MKGCTNLDIGAEKSDYNSVVMNASSLPILNETVAKINFRQNTLGSFLLKKQNKIKTKLLTFVISELRRHIGKLCLVYTGM